jgi:hypothetical protein
MLINNKSRGGSRPNSGAKPKYGEKTDTVSFRVPISKIPEVKIVVKSMIESFKRSDLYKKQ